MPTPRPRVTHAAWLLAGILAAPALAAGGTGGLSVSSIRIAANGDVIGTLAGSHLNPDGCTEKDKVLLLHGDPHRARLHSILLMAKSTGETASFWVAGCIERGGTTYPRARTITWRP